MSRIQKILTVLVLSMVAAGCAVSAENGCNKCPQTSFNMEYFGARAST